MTEHNRGQYYGFRAGPPAWFSRRRRLKRNSLTSQILVRIGSAIAVLWAAVTLSFISIHLAPGDIVSLLIGEQLRTPGVEAAIRLEWGLDKPLLSQYLTYLLRVLHGDFGRSYILQTDVCLVLSQMLPTLKLTAAALVVAVVFAVASALLTTGWRLPRSIADSLELILISTPSFWLGIVLLFIFSFTLKIFPVAGDRTFSALVLPALSLGLFLGAVIGQVLRQGLERTLEEPFMLTVKSWGANDFVLRLRHGLRHAALPAVTLAGWLVGNLLSGAVITEAVFGRSGLGRITVDAVLAHDLPVVLAVAILSAFIYVILSTLVDVLYLLLDPRRQRLYWRVANPGFTLSAIFLLLLTIATIWPQVLTAANPIAADPLQAQLPPSTQHWFGTDHLGRDVFARVVYGARYSILIGVSAVVIAAIVGAFLGLLSCLALGLVDEAISRFLDVISSFPDLLLALVLISFTGPGTINLIFALGLASVPRFARVVRAQTFVIAKSGYVEQAKTFGLRRSVLVARHILPHALAQVPILATIGLGTTIIQAAGLSFLGMGPQPPAPEWGAMLAEARNYLRVAWWIGVWPGLAITLTLISISVLGRRWQLAFEGRRPS